MIDTDAIKSTIDLANLIEAELGPPQNRGAWLFWRCPFHADRSPSLGVKADRFHCFGCEADGDVIEWIVRRRNVTFAEACDALLGSGRAAPNEVALLAARVAALERKDAEKEARLSALERMARCEDYLTYHARVYENGAMEYWASQGVPEYYVQKYLLGWCPRCPTDSQGRASYTIPVINRGALRDIRHRLVDAGDGDKYRPHTAGLGVRLFNADWLDDDGDVLCIVEGEKKSIVMDSIGVPAVGVMGQNGFNAAWSPAFDGKTHIYVMFDPRAEENAHRLAGLFGGRGHVVELPAKPDDLVTVYGATPADFDYFLRAARPVEGSERWTRKRSMP